MVSGERPVIRFEKPQVCEVVRPVLRFGDESKPAEEVSVSGERPVISLEVDPDCSDAARFARFRRMGGLWERVVDGGAS